MTRATEPHETRPLAATPTPTPRRRPRPTATSASPPAPITVLHVFGVMDRAGAELVTVDLMRRLDPARFRFVFVTLAGRPGALAEEIRSLGGSVHPCALGPSFPGRFVRLVRAVQPDVVQSHVATFSGVVLLLAAAAAVPRRIAHFHSISDRHGGSARGRAQRAVMRILIDRCATDLIAVAEAAMDGLWRWDWRRDPRCEVLYNGLDVGQFERALNAVSPRPAGQVPVIAHVGRPDPVKKRTAAVDVLVELHRRGVPANLKIVGRQDPRENIELRRRARLGGVADAVELTGESFDVPGLLAEADLLLVTSRHEGLPTVVLEARAVGTPVLAPALPGIAEIARALGGVTLLPRGSPKAAWAAEAARLTAIPPTSADRADAFRAFAESPFLTDRWRRDLIRVWTRGVG